MEDIKSAYMSCSWYGTNTKNNILLTGYCFVQKYFFQSDQWLSKIGNFESCIATYLSMQYFILKWYKSSQKIGDLLCNTHEQIQCLQHNIIKIYYHVLPFNGVSPKIILIRLKDVYKCKLKFRLDKLKQRKHIFTHNLHI